MNDSIGVIGGADGPTAIAMGSTFMGIFLALYFLIIFFALAFGIASYVLSSLGLYAIAERRKLRHPWLAWVPIGSAWLLGSISDQYQYVVKGKATNRRKMLLALNVAIMVAYIGWMVCMVGSMIGGYMSAMLFGVVVGWLLFGAVLIPLYIFLYIAYYDLFRSCQPSNAVLYLVLSILIPVTLPFFVFFVRKKDLGMPPRKQPPVAETVVAEAPAEGIGEEITEETVEEQAEEPAQETVEEPTEE